MWLLASAPGTFDGRSSTAALGARHSVTRRILYDPGEPVPIARYWSEPLAALDQAVLTAAGIPSIIGRESYTEAPGPGVVLIVRRTDISAAQEVLGTGDEATS
jgi:hypothetical protein